MDRLDLAYARANDQIVCQLFRLEPTARSDLFADTRRHVARFHARIRFGLAHERGAVVVLVLANVEQRYQRIYACRHRTHGQRASAPPTSGRTNGVLNDPVIAMAPRSDARLKPLP